MATKVSFHENFSHKTDVRPSSDRAFGLTIGAVLAAFGTLELISSDPSNWIVIALWCLASALIFSALILPTILAPLNSIWQRLGLLLSKVTNPIVMGLIFFAVITPAGLLMRMLGAPLLGEKQNADSSSYWILRDPPGPKPETMKRQF